MEQDVFGQFLCCAACASHRLKVYEGIMSAFCIRENKMFDCLLIAFIDFYPPLYALARIFCSCFI